MTLRLCCCGCQIAHVFASAEEAQIKADALTRSIKSSWKDLNQIELGYGTLMGKRWSKKSPAQRKALLLSAWPDMPAERRPDFVMWKRLNLGLVVHKDECVCSQAARRNRSTHLMCLKQNPGLQESFMYPYISQEDLSSSSPVPLMLNSRGRHPPARFVSRDSLAVNLGWIFGAIPHQDLDEHRMMFPLIGDEWEDFGKIAQEDQRVVLTGYTVLTVAKGFVVLESQARTYEFLVMLSKAILHDFDNATLFAVSTLKTDEIQGEEEEASSTFASFEEMTANAPYQPPGRLDLKRLVAMFAAKVSASEDHLWSLREDPGYFSDTLINFKEHSLENLLDHNGKRCIIPGYSPWAYSLCLLVNEALSDMESWDYIHGSLVELQELDEEHGYISGKSTVSEEFLQLFAGLFWHLVHQSTTTSSAIGRFFAASPPMRTYYRYSKTLGGLQMNINSRDRYANEMVATMDLLRNTEKQRALGLHNVLDEVSRCAAKYSEYITSKVANTLGDLSLLSFCESQLYFLSPGIEQIRTEFEEPDCIHKMCHRGGLNWSELPYLHLEDIPVEAVEAATPNDGRFKYPVEKLRSKAVVDKMRSAEEALAKVWENLEKHVEAWLKVSSRLRKLFSERKIGRTSPWNVPDEPHTAAVDAVSTFDAYSIPHIPSNDSVLRLKISSTLVKVKTRGRKSENVFPHKWPAKYIPADATTSDETALPPKNAAPSKYAAPIKEVTFLETVSSAENDGQSNLMAPRSDELQDVVQVDKRTMKVFTILFHMPSTKNQPGDIPWTEFLTAMQKIDFSGQKLYGSVWQFTPGGTLKGRHNILFHEPHPSKRIPFHVARRHGRRLTRTYGLSGETFVLN